MLSASLRPELLTWPTATTTYSSVERTLQYIADLPPHPSISIFELQFPTTRASALQAFRVHLDSLNTELQIAQRKIGNRTKLKIVAVINSIASVPGVYLPWKEMVALCRERGILTVIDAAHSIGQEPNINLSEADPDFWASVGHILPKSTRAPCIESFPELLQVVLWLSSMWYPLCTETVCFARRKINHSSIKIV